MPLVHDNRTGKKVRRRKNKQPDLPIGEFVEYEIVEARQGLDEAAGEWTWIVCYQCETKFDSRQIIWKPDHELRANVCLCPKCGRIYQNEAAMQRRKGN